MTKRSLTPPLLTKRSLLAVSALLGLELFGAMSISQGATNLYFDPNGTTSLGGPGTWDAGTTADWNTASTAPLATPQVWPNTTAYAADFTTTGGIVTVASGGVTTAGISITATGETFNGGAIALGTGGISYNATNVNPIFNTEIDLAGSAATSTFHSGGLTLNGNIVEESTTASTLSMSVNAINASASFLGNITAATTGSLNLAITGSYSTSTTAPPIQPTTSGTFTFSGNNTGLLSTNTTTIGAYSGSAYGGGDVVLNNANALGASAVVFAKGAPLVAGTFNAFEASLETGTAGLTIANSITVNADTNANNAHVYNIGTNASVTTGTTTFSGNIANNNTVQSVNLLASKAGTITQFTGVASGSAFATAGAGTISLKGANTFTGGISVVSGSTLSLDTATTLQAATGATTVTGMLTSTVANATLGGSLGITGGTITPNGAAVGALTLATTSGFTMSTGKLSFNIASAGSYDQLISSGGAGATFAITGGTLDLNLGTANSSIYSSSYSILSGFTSGSVSGLAITDYDTTDYSASLSNLGVLSFTAVPEPGTGVMMLVVLAVLGVPMWHASRQGTGKCL